MSDRSPRYLPLAHRRFKHVDPVLFRATFVPDCMDHPCRQNHEGQGDFTPRADACCNYGADVDLWERDAVLGHASKVAPYLPPELQDTSLWFDRNDVEAYPEFPSGIATRTATRPGAESRGCVFLHHADGARGCVLHRTAMDHAIPLRGFKPMICRLFPVSFMGDALCLSDDFDWYDCAGSRGGPTVYRVMRDTLRDVFDRDLVSAMDAAEASLGREAGMAARALPVIP